MESAPRDFDAMTGRVITRGLEGLMFRCVLNTDHRRAYEVYEKGKGSAVLWTLTLDRYQNPTPHMTDRVTNALRQGLRTPDRRKKARA